MNKNLKDKGITLIALLVTMIILIILFGVIVGIAEEDGLIGKADKAANIYMDASKEEDDIFSGVTDLLSKEKDEQLMETLKSNLMSNPEAYRHPNQSETNKDRAIGADGKPVNLDLWEYLEKDDGVYMSGSYGNAGYFPAYRGSITEDGRIEGSVPMYFVMAGSDKVCPLLDMSSAFVGIEKLKIAPEIPETVENMHSTFKNCASLLMPPKLPRRLKYMEITFSGCESLQEAPEIPCGVVELANAFSFCSSLLVPPKLPDGLNGMLQAFVHCSNLREFPVIPSSVSDIQGVFYGCNNISGILTIKSSNCILGSYGKWNDPFYGCTKDITVRVPAYSDTFSKLERVTNEYPNIYLEVF